MGRNNIHKKNSSKFAQLQRNRKQNIWILKLKNGNSLFF